MFWNAHPFFLKVHSLNLISFLFNKRACRMWTIRAEHKMHLKLQTSIPLAHYISHPFEMGFSPLSIGLTLCSRTLLKFFWVLSLGKPFPLRLRRFTLHTNKSCMRKHLESSHRPPPWHCVTRVIGPSWNLNKVHRQVCFPSVASNWVFFVHFKLLVCDFSISAIPPPSSFAH